MRRVGWLLAAATAALVMAVPTATAATSRTIYRSNVQPLPGNLPSIGFEADSASELGDAVTFAPHGRHLQTVTVTMSSWGCQQGTWFGGDCVTTPGAKFSVPITLNLYNASGATLPSATPVEAVGPIASVTKTFRIPYRPSASPKCTGAAAGEWFLKKHGCFNGKAANIVFNLASLHLKLPNTIVWGVAYNTTHHGYDPIGESAACFTSSGGCPYDSLNVAGGPAVKVGSKPYADRIFWNTSFEGFLCDSGDVTPVALTNAFNLDAPGTGPNDACWAGFVPAVQFRATS